MELKINVIHYGEAVIVKRNKDNCVMSLELWEKKAKPEFIKRGYTITEFEGSKEEKEEVLKGAFLVKIALRLRELEGIVLDYSGRHYLSADDIKAWEKAQEEYDRLKSSSFSLPNPNEGG